MRNLTANRNEPVDGAEYGLSKYLDSFRRSRHNRKLIFWGVFCKFPYGAPHPVLNCLALHTTKFKQFLTADRNDCGWWRHQLNTSLCFKDSRLGLGADWKRKLCSSPTAAKGQTYAIYLGFAFWGVGQPDKILPQLRKQVSPRMPLSVICVPAADLTRRRTGLCSQNIKRCWPLPEFLTELISKYPMLQLKWWQYQANWWEIDQGLGWNPAIFYDYPASSRWNKYRSGLNY